MSLYRTKRKISWDKLFRPKLMNIFLRLVGLRNKIFCFILNGLSFSLLTLFAVPYTTIASLVLSTIGNKAYSIHRFGAWCWLAFFGIYRRSWFHASFDQNENYIIMAEHFSMHDLPLYTSTWPLHTRGLSAREYSRIPIYGWVIRTAGSKFIERRDTQQAIKDLEDLKVELSEKKLSILMAPTGTRVSEVHPYKPFKKGVFHFAAALKRPIVPLYLIGIESLIMNKYFIRPGRVDVVYGSPIKPEDYPEAFSNPESLLELVYSRMKSESSILRKNRQQLIKGNLLYSV